MSNCFLADNNGAPWAVIGAGFDTDTVTAQGLSSRQTRRTRGGDFHWPPVGTFAGHHRGLSHGHGQAVPDHVANSLVDELKKLADLHQAGVLSEDEFTMAKARLLAGS